MSTSIDNSDHRQRHPICAASDSTATAAPEVFVDPVGYLATFGIESDLIEVRVLPAAA